MPELYEAKASKIREMVSELEDELRMAKAYIEYLKEQIRVAHNVGVAAASINPTATPEDCVRAILNIRT